MAGRVAGRLAAAGPAERVVQMVGRLAGAGGGTSTRYLIFEHEGELYRARPDDDTGERVWSRWPSGQPCPCPMDEVE